VLSVPYHASLPRSFALKSQSSSSCKQGMVFITSTCVHLLETVPTTKHRQQEKEIAHEENL